jgi:hypothetical protein
LTKKFPHVDAGLISTLFEDSGFNVPATLQNLQMLCAQIQATQEEKTYTKDDMVRDLCIAFPSLSKDFVGIVLDENECDCAKTVEFLKEFTTKMQAPLVSLVLLFDLPDLATSTGTP